MFRSRVSTSRSFHLTASKSWAERLASGPVWIVLALIMAAALKIGLLTAGAVPFNSDEAIVALMARHILGGEFPTFFYGQAYMGSLDAFLVAASFRLFGETVQSIRLVQIALYLAYLLSLAWLAKQASPSPSVWRLAVVLAAVPPVLVTTYTTATLGGYGEILVLGNLILGLGFRALRHHSRNRAGLWLGLGVVSGLAFWTLGLAVISMLPVGVLLLRRFERAQAPNYALAGLGFLLGSAPWWLYNWANDGAALRVFFQDTPMQSTLGLRLAGFLALGLPTLLGIRHPWSGEYLPAALVFLGLMLYLSVGAMSLHRARQGKPIFRPPAGRVFMLMGLGFVALFAGSQFGVDSTGRYFLPLFAPLILLTAKFVELAWRWKPWAGAAVIAAYMTLQGFASVDASLDAAKITTQFDPITRFDNSHDQRLIEFLESQDLRRGYSNYWVTYRLAFLSQEELLLAPQLPYKPDLRYTPRDDRYPAYSQAVQAAKRLAYVTTQHPVLDARLRAGFDRLGVSYSERAIGPYHVFYDLSAPIRPEHLKQELRPLPP